jgi:hypothetical protein
VVSFQGEYETNSLGPNVMSLFSYRMSLIHRVTIHRFHCIQMEDEKVKGIQLFLLFLFFFYQRLSVTGTHGCLAHKIDNTCTSVLGADY